MLIAIDYDGTYTEDPVMWLSMILMMKRCGHKVICVTMRTPEECESIDPNLEAVVEAIIATGREAKAKFAAEAGFKPDIWIDDNPMWLYTNAAPAKKESVLATVGLG